MFFVRGWQQCIEASDALGWAGGGRRGGYVRARGSGGDAERGVRRVMRWVSEQPCRKGDHYIERAAQGISDRYLFRHYIFYISHPFTYTYYTSLITYHILRGGAPPPNANATHRAAPRLGPMARRGGPLGPLRALVVFKNTG